MLSKNYPTDLSSSKESGHKGLFHVGHAITGLVFTILSSSAVGQTGAIQGTQNASILKNPAASSQSSAKGGGQVVTLKDGREMSFMDIAGLPEKEKEEVLEGLSDNEFTAFTNFLKEKKQAAINNTAKIRKSFEDKEQKMVTEVPKIVPLFESKKAKGEKLTEDQVDILRFFLANLDGKISQDWQLRIKRLLES